MPVVLFVSYAGIWGGAERLLVQFAGAPRGEICLACPDGPLARAGRDAGLRVFPLREHALEVRATLGDRVLSAARLTGHAVEIRTLIRDLDPDLVVAWGMRSALACLATARSGGRTGPVVVFQHNDLLPGGIISALVRAAAARADLVIALSHAIATDLDPGRRLAGRLQVVHPGVDAGTFASDAAAAVPPEVLVLGALVDWKRPDLALEVCALARRRHPELRLRLVGAPLAGEDAIVARLRERASAPDLAGSVELTGAVADPRPALERATVLLHCAEREPFGLAVLEALAAGRPAVVPAAAGPAEIVDRACAVLYPPGDADAAADGIVALLDDPARARRMGAHGRVRACEQFGRAAALERYAAALAPVTRPDRTPRPVTGGSLALVTVTHDSALELGALLRSVDRHLPGVRIVVADCDSHDDSAAVARSWRGSGSVDLVALEQNIGFGRACNRALQAVTEPVAVLLNPDVELVDDSLLALAQEAARVDRPERLLAPLVLAGDGSRQDSVHPRPTSPADLARALVPPALVPGPVALPIAPWRGQRPRRVGWAVGCALAAKTDTLRRLGPFDERIFLYGEDLDLGLRAAAAGVETWFWPTARVLHHRAHSTDAAFGGEPFELLASARREVVARVLGPPRARLDDLAQGVTFASRLALKRAIGRASERERRQLDALRAARR